jgi:hypothetical protein
VKQNQLPLVDIPFHALVSFNLGFIGVEGFGGYYLSAVSTPDFNLSGAEVGAKVFLGPVYGSFFPSIRWNSFPTI